jgi:hypothetical protein
MKDLEIIDKIQEAFHEVLSNNNITNDSMLFRKINEITNVDKKIIKNYYQIIDSDKTDTIDALHKGDLTINKALFECSGNVKYYRAEEIEIMTNDLLINVPVKQICRNRGPEFNRNPESMIKKVRQIKRSLSKGFTLEEIINNKTTETYHGKPKTMRDLRFYTLEEEDILKKAISSGEPIKNIATRLAVEFNRPIIGLSQKLRNLKKQIPDIKSKIVKERFNFQPEPVVEQQPADIGVDVPHGMTFEGKPKRISLHSDHFRIYF